MKKLTLFIIAISCQLLALSFTAHAQHLRYTTLYNFTNTTLDRDNGGPQPNNLIASVTGDTLFGTSYQGGKYKHGSIFYITANGSVYDTLMSFSGTDRQGENLTSGLVLSGKVLYGMTDYGGKYGTGLIFSIHTDGTHYDTLHNFGWGTMDGISPNGGLVLSAAGILYGTTNYGGALGQGTIFRINTDGSYYDTLHSFGGFADGAGPNASLTLSGNVLYGTTIGSGQFGDGIIFSIDTDGTHYDTLHNFGAGFDGQQPQGSLLINGSTLYGMTTFGGTYSDGMAFSIHTDGTHYDTLHNFGWGANDGSNPDGSFILVNNVLYSVTNNGGQSNAGLLFSINTNGSGYDTLHNFGNGTDGQNPDGTLLCVNNTLFGGTIEGGTINHGNIFSYTLFGPVTSVISNVSCHGGENGNAGVATVFGGTSPYTYSWSDGSTSASAGTALSAATYTVTVTDNTSNTSTATVTITQPTAIAISPSLTAATGSADGTASATVSGGTSPYTYSWAPISATTSSVSSLSAGTYTCTVTDANGCENYTTFDITGTDAGINEVKGESGEVSIYPNPSNGQFTIQLAVGSGQLAVVEVYNVLGEEVLTETLRSSQGDNTLNMSNQPQGIYLYRVITNNGELIGEGKIIVQR